MSIPDDRLSPLGSVRCLQVDIQFYMTYPLDSAGVRNPCSTRNPDRERPAVVSERMLLL